MKFFFSCLSPKAPYYWAYMLQNVEYDLRKFHDWLKELRRKKTSLSSVTYRRSLALTNRTKSLLLIAYASGIVTVLIFLLIVRLAQWYSLLLVAVVVSYVSAIAAMFAAVNFVVWFAKKAFLNKELQKTLARSKSIFSSQKANKIVVAGSYGKTTMKELLVGVLSEKFKVSFTPGNKNTHISHGRFARQLSGDEDFLVLELGEGEPGDVETFASTIRPDYGVVTGLAPNHLDYYGTIDKLAADFLTLKNFIKRDKLFFSAESQLLNKYLSEDDQVFSLAGVMDYKISKIKSELSGLSFCLTEGKEINHFSSHLLGTHQVAPVALVAALALSFGMDSEQIQNGLDKIYPYEHRMNPLMIGGACVIDDTYNGNLEGVTAGLQLLSELPAKRKWYVTPGLVDQGEEKERVHKKIAALVFEAKPDKLVLMQNSATAIIAQELKRLEYSGQIQLETDPLAFYSNLEHHVVGGDLVLMQNDWTDNYF